MHCCTENSARIRRRTQPVRPAAAAVALCLLAAAAWAVPTGVAPSLSLVEWGGDLDAAFGRAQVSMKPVLVLFTSPRCPLCYRLKAGPLRSERLQPALRGYERAEVDVSRRPELALQYRVRGVPAFRVLEPDGRLRGGFEGYASSAELVARLEHVGKPRRRGPELGALAKRLASGGARTNDWAEAMLAMGSQEGREAVRSAVLAGATNAVDPLVACLADRRLAVRLGALEILEELSGDTMGLDPWADRHSPRQIRALARWRGWRGNTNIGHIVYAAMTEQAFERHVQDLVGPDSDRARRAVRVLAQGGPPVARGMVRYLEERPDLNEAAVRRIREVQYSLVIPLESGLNPLVSAHRLVWGNQDVRLQTIRQLTDCGAAAMPILVDLLKDPDPLVREVAAETAFIAADRYAVKPLSEHLKQEKDPDVIYAILRRLAKVKTGRSLAVLEAYFTHKHEDLAIAAIEGAAKIAVTPLDSKLLPLLDDERWRVRVAVLQALIEKESKNRAVAGAVLARLNDPDEFVRHIAVKAIARLKPAGAEKHLRKAYAQHPDMRGLIVGAMLNLDLPLGPEIESDMFEAAPGILLQVLVGIYGVDKENRTLLHRAARGKDADVACAALRVIADTDDRDPADNAVLIEALRSGMKERQLTVMQEFDLSSKRWRVLERDTYERTLRQSGRAPSDRPAPPPGTDGRRVEQLIRSLLRRPPPRSAPAEPGPAAPASPPPARLGRATDDDTILAVEALMHDATAPELVRRHAMLLLCRCRHVGAFRLAVEQWAELVASQRAAVARTLAEFGEEAVPLFKRALADENTDVWQASVCVFTEKNAGVFVTALFEQLLEPDARLKPTMIWPWGLDSLGRKGLAQVGALARTLLEKHPDRSDLAVLALSLMTGAAPPGADRIALEFTRSGNPFVRRAAWLVLVAADQQKFIARLDTIRNDSSWYVREVLPAWYYKDSYEKRIDLYFSEDERHTDYNGLRIEYGSSLMRRAPPAQVVTVLRELGKDDPEPWIRLQCMLTLLSHRVPVDLNEVLAAARACSRRQAVTERVYEFLDDCEEFVGPSFNVVFPLLKKPDGQIYGSSLMARLQKKWGGAPEPEPTHDATSFAFAASRAVAKQPVMPTFDGAPAAPRARAARPGAPVPLVFFTTPGCRECRAIERRFPRLARAYPMLRVEKHNIRAPAGIKRNEALCERFGVDPPERGLTPAVFMAGGYLAGAALTFDALDALAERSAGQAFPDQDWTVVSTNELAAASEAVEQRGRDLALPVVVGAGLLDGVNPCAFAAIVFLISYLRVRKRTGPAMIGIGAAYVLAVFLTYFLLGLGLADIVARVRALEWLGHLLNGLLALFLFVIAWLSLRDAVRCLRGRADQMTLQLPGRLKQGIRTAIRHGTAWRRHVLAAALLGVAVSVLELSCTGQVYLPTIVFMIRTDTARTQALGLLLAYNLAFVAPLVVVFAMTVAGTRSDALQRFMMRHVAPVKFALAILFGLLACLLARPVLMAALG